jgi:HAD superfamily hydrolase (TIGR01509 family)
VQQIPPEARAAARRLRPFRLRAVLFDFDGTLTRPGALDFDAIKQQVGCPPDRYVLEFIEGLTGGERAVAEATLEHFELQGAAGSTPNPGAADLVRALREAGLRVGVLTRNSRAAVDSALARIPSLPPWWFDVIVTRDDGLPYKPAPDGVLHACAAMGVPPAETLVVGDFLLDIEAGNAAGAVTAFLTNGGAGEEDGGGGAAGGGAAERAAGEAAAQRAAAAADVVVHGLTELSAVVELGLPLPAGKLPNAMLARFLGGVGEASGDVIVGAGVGEDVAALDVGGDEVLAVHADPITLSGGDLGRWAVTVNANDVATAGASPRWLLTTVLLPPGTTGSQALTLLEDVAAAAAAQGIALVGGHTEVTDAVTRPLVSSTMLGTVRRAELRDKRGARTGDDVVLTKGVAVEGTALLAREMGGRLAALGMSDGELAACTRLLDAISIVPEARIATGFPGVRALHDVTEGGLATALRELAAATGRGVVVHRERIPVLPETRRLCDLLGADPLGLIGSGSLLICCRHAETEALLTALRAAGIAAAVIGKLDEEGAGVAALERGRPAPWPRFAADEAARLLAPPTAP